MSHSTRADKARLNPQQYDAFRAFLERSCGIVLGDSKQYLVGSRLAGVLDQYDVADIGELLQRLERFSERRLKQAVIDAMTTNETLWFRDSHPYEILRQRLLPELQSTRGSELKIWSAACSSGQEPYSISIAVEEYRSSAMGLLRRPVNILASDVSGAMLEACRQAEYARIALARGMSEERLQRWFEAVGDDRWRVKKALRERVEVRTVNLKEDFRGLGTFDIIFCRNVLIYFSHELKSSILTRLHAALRPGGYLFLGASESLGAVADRFEAVPCKPGFVYRAR